MKILGIDADISSRKFAIYDWCLHNYRLFLCATWFKLSCKGADKCKGVCGYDGECNWWVGVHTGVVLAFSPGSFPYLKNIYVFVIKDSLF